MPARMVLYFLSLSGFLVSFVMRNDINIAIVAMVEQAPSSVVTNSSGVSCFAIEEITNTTILVSNRNLCTKKPTLFPNRLPIEI